MGWLLWCWDLLSVYLIVRAGARQITRATTTYRVGIIGKIAAVTLMALSTTVIAGWILPFGALWVLSRRTAQLPDSVPLADGWPGQR